MTELKKLAVVVGHNSHGQGAVRKDTGESEYIWNGKVADIMTSLAGEFGLEVKVFRREYVGSYRREINAVYDKVDRWAPDGSLELHFNASASPKAHGAEMLSSGTAKSLTLAQAIQNELVAGLGARDRGVHTVPPSGRGGRSLIAGRAPAVLAEPFFASNARDLGKTDELRERVVLARAYLKGAAKAFGALPRSDLRNSRVIKNVVATDQMLKVKAISLSGSAVSALATQAQDSIAKIPAIGDLAVWLPYITVGLILVAFAANVWSKTHTARIRAAREDDHRRGMEL